MDELIALDPDALTDAELAVALEAFARSRARFDAAELAVIAAFDRRGGYLLDGAVNTRSWLAHETKAARAVAGGRVLLAKRLRRMPAMATALAAGRVTEAHARSMGRCLTPRTLAAFARDEEMLVARARKLEADEFDTVVAEWLRLNDEDGPDPGGGEPSVLHASRTFGDRVKVDGDLDAGDGAEFLAELDALYDELWRPDQACDDGDPARHRTCSERNAAALVEMARRSSAARPADSGDDDRGGRRPLLVVVVDVDPLVGWASARGTLEDGSLLPRSTLDRWACDSAFGRVLMKGKSLPVDVGTISYTTTASQRRALVARDRGCSVPGCKRRPRWCEAHHVVPWPEGPTTLDNLILVCSRHHHLIHGGRLRVVRDPHDVHRWIITRPDGTALRQRPPPRVAA
jgi:5-methylcytosine-specific restriction protein A